MSEYTRTQFEAYLRRAKANRRRRQRNAWILLFVVAIAASVTGWILATAINGAW